MLRRNFLTTLSKSSLLLYTSPKLLSFFSDPPANFLLGKGSIRDFEKVEDQFLEKETAIHYLKMQEEARKEGIQIQLISGYRSYARQKKIFEAKYKSLIKTGIPQLEAIQDITTYSSIPGTSRHHWGTDIDVIQHKEELPIVDDVLTTEYYSQEGRYSEMHEWMQLHAEKFGFHLAYTDDSSRSGYAYEPWHYSYVPKSKPYLQAYLASNFASQLHEFKVEGLQDLNEDFFITYIETYVKGVNSELK